MDREIAEALIKCLQEMEGPINRANDLIAQVSDEKEQKMLREPLGELVGHHFTLMLPLIRAFPDLDPDKDAAWLKELRSRRGGSKE